MNKDNYKKEVTFDEKYFSRYSKQIAFEEFGIESQRRLANSSALVVGIGGIGSWTTELLVRAGIGHIRIVDDDFVQINNIHRQAFYNENDAHQRKLKIDVAMERLGLINSCTHIEPVYTRYDRINAEKLSNDVDVIVDGTDNFQTRFIINDCAVKHSKPWVFAGVLGTQAQIMAIIPAKTPCLRCLMKTLPKCDYENQQNCCNTGVLGPAVAMTSAYQASEILKLLSGNETCINPNLFVFDFWQNRIKQLDVQSLRNNCPCCVQHDYEYLEGFSLDMERF